MISKEEWENGDRKALFEKYFYGDEVIDLQQMCGLLYYNLGIEAWQNEDYTTAYKNFEKAYFLHPGSRMKYFVSTSLALHLYKANLNEDEKLTAISRYMQVGDSAVAKDYILDLVSKMSKKYLFQYPDLSRYNSLYGSVVNLIKDSSSLSSIKHDHYYDMAHYYSIKEQPDSSKRYLDSLYTMNTNDLIVRELMTNTIYGLIRKVPEGKEGAVAVKDYFKAYPFLSSNNTLQDYYVFCLVREAGLSYDLENEKEGRVYLDDLKKFLDGQPAVARRSEKVIEMLLSEACGYYTRKQNYQTVRDICMFFKMLLPDNANINQRLTNAEKRMNNK
jgi:tetratricopeptide (TPR) repeat protein